MKLEIKKRRTIFLHTSNIVELLARMGISVGKDLGVEAFPQGMLRISWDDPPELIDTARAIPGAVSIAPTTGGELSKPENG